MVIEVIRSKSSKQRYRIRLKFSNGLICMHSERLYQKAHAHKVAARIMAEDHTIKVMEE